MAQNIKELNEVEDLGLVIWEAFEMDAENTDKTRVKKVSPLKDSADVSDRSQILIFAHEKVAGKWVMRKLDSTALSNVYSANAVSYLLVNNDGSVIVSDGDSVRELIAKLSEDENPKLGGNLDTNKNRVLLSKGSNIASANIITLEGDDNGNLYPVTGTTKLRFINGSTWSDGSVVSLVFTDGLEVEHNASPAAVPNHPVILACGRNYMFQAGDVLTLTLIGKKWIEGTTTGGVNVFTGLYDTPSTYTANKVVSVKSDAEGLEFKYGVKKGTENNDDLTTQGFVEDLIADEMDKLDCPYDLAFALGDEETDLDVGDKVEIYVTRGFEAEKITVVLNDAPVGTALKVKISVKRSGAWSDVGVVTVADGATQGVLTSFDTDIFSDNDLIRGEVTQVGSTNTGAGAKVYVKGSLKGAVGGGGVGNPKEQDLGSISGNVEIDLSLGTCVIATLTASTTLSFTGLPPSGEILEFTLNFTAIKEINWPVGTTVFNGGAAMIVLSSPYTYSCDIDSSGNLRVWGVAEWA